MKKEIIAIIPAKGSSRGVPKKNSKLLGGKPLVSYTIEECLKSKYITRTIVSTDDKEIARISEECGAEIPFIRPKNLAKHTSSSLSVITYALKYLSDNEKYKADLVVFLQPTSPFRKAKQIDEAIERLLDDDELIGAFGAKEVEEHPYMMFRKTKKGEVKPIVNISPRPMRRQEFPELFITNASIYVTRAKYFEGIDDSAPVCPIFDEKTSLVLMDKESSLDINNPLDFSLCKEIVKQKESLDKIYLDDRKIGENEPTLIVAEMAGGHNGEFDRAIKMIKVASDSGAEAIKLHMYNPKDYITKTHKLFKAIQNLAFDEKEWKRIFQEAKKQNLKIIAVPADLSSTKLAGKLGTDAYFIYPSCIDEIPILEEASEKGKPIFIQTGGVELEEIETAISYIKKKNKKIILIHGFQAFPTKLEDIKLNYLPMLKERFNTLIGIEDHTAGDSKFSKIAPLVAIPYKVSAIFKHFTLDREEKLIDYESALNPDELKELVGLIRGTEEMIGYEENITFSEDEKKYRDYIKKRLVANKDLEEGSILKEEDLTLKRSEGEYYSKDNLIGKKVLKFLKKDEAIFPEHIENSKEI